MVNDQISNPIYRSRCFTVTAWQFTEGEELPVWVAASSAIKKDGKLLFKRGAHVAVEPNPGDWLVKDVLGNVSIFKDEEFKRAFERMQ